MGRSVESIILDLGLDRLLEDSQFDWDIREGVVFSQAKTRVCLFSTDLLEGVYKAVSEEAGEAWPLIFKSCGEIWGKRLAKRLDQEFQLLFQKLPEQLSVSDYIDMVTAYFASHGWGLVTLDVDKAQETGVIEIRMENSIFCDIVDDSEEMADSMMAGIFASLISHISRRELDCLQTACQSKGAPASLFVLTASSRVESAANEVRAGSTHEQVLAEL